MFDLWYSKRMIDNTSYTSDNKFMTVARNSSLQEFEKVPVALVDELLERGLSGNELATLMKYRAFTRTQQNIRKVKISSLVGEDLTGKNVTVESDMSDSVYARLVTTNKAVGVIRLEGAQYFTFVFPEGAEYSELQNSLFAFYEYVLISEDLN